MFRISKQFTFAAGHILDGLPKGHKCGRPHGHNYTVRVTVGAPELDAAGFVVDYGDLAPFRHWLDSQWDHRWLGNGPVTALGQTWAAVMRGNPTAELMAAHMKGWLERNWLPDVVASEHLVLTPVEVAVSETGNTWAWT